MADRPGGPATFPRPVLAANWKMNNGPAQAKSFVDAFLQEYAARNDRTIVVFPPALSLPAVADGVRGRTDIRVGTQNIHWAEKGAFTGEISAEMARDAGASLVLVGHSERRHVFGETDDMCAKKCAAAERAGLAFMLCVGETLQQREADATESVVLGQLEAGLSGLRDLSTVNLLLAYEPVWAIGTGLNAKPGDASAIHALLRSKLHDIVGARAAAIPILYGGSVNDGNARVLLAAPEVDGLLVGGASVEVASWLKISGVP